MIIGLRGGCGVDNVNGRDEKKYMDVPFAKPSCSISKRLQAYPLPMRFSSCPFLQVESIRK